MALREEPNMTLASKLKSETSINMLLPAIVTLTVWAALWRIFDFRTAQYWVAAVFILYGLFSLNAYVRTKNIGYLTASMFQILAGLSLGARRHGPLFIAEKVDEVMWFVAMMFMIWTMALLLTRKFKWRGREILELAAQPIEDVTNGFTQRPRPVGRIDHSREDIAEFARFASRNLVAMPYAETDRMVFVPVSMAQSFKHLYPWRHDYTNDTWVAFDSNGEVSVNVAQKDYLQYKDSLSFDQLCQSLGNLFVEFLELYKRGEGVRIIDRMNALRMNPYT